MRRDRDDLQPGEKEAEAPDTEMSFLERIFGEDVPVRGVEVNYVVVCPRKCWLFVHGVEHEAGSELVALGRLLHETSFRRQAQRNVDIEGFARVDFTSEGIMHEVKRGPTQHRAHVLQLAYYLLLLRERGVETQGILHYPRQRRREIVQLGPDLESELQDALRKVREIRQMPTPPAVPRRMAVCRSCAYDEFCWGDEFDESEDV
ncbi:MAG: CRISPR-associated protein Cas4 [Armatimonadetes bacterium]|nr:CRISPR-associated protein Cas4 [Armatimonadota bacterium]MDW8154307.1 CRISPR-associated protein Cas4 [Armatimonadota bacterium]